MRALTFTCRALLVLVLVLVTSPDVTASTAGSSPSLIGEKAWPRGCVVDCHRGRHRAVCGSNGRKYKSLCAFQRAQCVNAQLRLAPSQHCSDHLQTKCQLARGKALQAQSIVGNRSPAWAGYIPECGPEGHFLPTQCHNQTGYCWCSMQDGTPLSGTTVRHQRPHCSDDITRMAPPTHADPPVFKEGVSEAEPTLSPKKPEEMIAPPIWVTSLNSEPKGSRSVRQHDSTQSCERERERASLLSQLGSVWQEERFIPECTADGRYRPVQCHTATGYCWCVRTDGGRPLPGTSARNRIPECTGAEDHLTDRMYWDKPLPGCPGARKQMFIQSLMRALQLEAEHAGNLSLDLRPPPPPPPPAPSSPPPVHAPPSSDPELQRSQRQEMVLQYHFDHLDLDSDGVLSEREARTLRHFLRRRLKPRRCAKKFTQYCDGDADTGLTLQELRVCVGLTDETQRTAPR